MAKVLRELLGAGLGPIGLSACLLLREEASDLLLRAWGASALDVFDGGLTTVAVASFDAAADALARAAANAVLIEKARGGGGHLVVHADVPARSLPPPPPLPPAAHQRPYSITHACNRHAILAARGGLRLR
jgi:hypothetical protein